MHIPFSSTTTFTSTEGKIWDYLIDKEIGVSYQELNSRGPVNGKYLNKVCDEIYFIIEGVATFTVGDEVYQVKAKDVIIVEPNTPHFIETKGLKFFTITRPDWYEEQATIVE